MTTSLSELSSEDLDKFARAARQGMFGQKIRGRNIVFTGKMSMKREDMIRLARLCGGSPQIKVTWGTDYLVIGDTGTRVATIKMADAANHDVKVLTEEEFVALLLEPASD